MKVALFALPNPILAVPTSHFQQGLLYVASALLRAGHQVKIVDLRARRYITEADIPEADCIGVTATSGEIEWARTVARLAHAKGIKTMLGGAHATFMPIILPREAAEHYWDYIVKGDGELAAPEALRRRVVGIYEMPLDDLAGWFPAWKVIGEQGLSRELFTGAGYGQGPLTAGTLSSRGCPYHCSYCRSERDRVRYRPIEDVVTEIGGLIEGMGVRHYRFYDESLTLNKKRALELFAALEPLGIHIRAHTRSDAWDDELAAAYKQCGGEEMGFGFEAASDPVLEKIRKQETVEQHRQAVRVCKRHGLISKAFWMVGLPLQRLPEIEDIKRFMAEERPDRWIVSVFAAYPGSDVWACPVKYNVTYLDLDLSHYWNFPERPTIGYQDNSREDIWAQYQDLVAWLEKEFPR